MESALAPVGSFADKLRVPSDLAPAWDEYLLALNGFAPTGRPPDHVILSRGVEVTIFSLERV